MRKMGKEEKKPKCERDFEKKYDRVRQQMLRGPIEGYSVLSDYFKIQKDWVQPFLLEEQRGFAILQRLDRLIEQQLPKQQHTESDDSVKEKLTILRGEYWKHQLDLALLDAVKLINSPPVKEQMVLREFRDQLGRSFAWVQGQEGCAARGGCCGRGCGCCNKPLGLFLLPAKEQDPEKKETVVFGHCTVECRCCIEYRGCYVPDSRLPHAVEILEEGALLLPNIDIQWLDRLFFFFLFFFFNLPCLGLYSTYHRTFYHSSYLHLSVLLSPCHHRPLTPAPVRPLLLTAMHSIPTRLI